MSTTASAKSGTRAVGSPWTAANRPEVIRLVTAAAMTHMRRHKMATAPLPVEMVEAEVVASTKRKSSQSCDNIAIAVMVHVEKKAIFSYTRRS